jgi:hypothetical protein
LRYKRRFRIVIHSISEQRPDEILSSGKTNFIFDIKTKILFFLLLGIKNPNNNNNNGNCIITVLDANDLPPLNSNTSLDVLSANNSNNRNRRYENTNPNRNVLHRFLIFHRSDQSQT